jgi:arylsulfatase A-like enzyme
LHIVDWYPTLLKLAGASAVQKLPLDGRDLWPALTEGKPSPHDAILINAVPRSGAIRMGDWKLVRNGGVGANDLESAGSATTGKGKKKKGAAKSESGADQIELFNLAADPGEKNNLAMQHPEVVQRLAERLDGFGREALPPKAEGQPANYRAPAVWGEAN